MNMIFLRCVLGLIFCVVSSGTCWAADLIIVNAKITTLNKEMPHAVAAAVKDDVFIRVGDNKEILALKTEKTKVIDA